MGLEILNIIQQLRWHLEAVSQGKKEASGWTVAVEPIPFTIGRDDNSALKINAKWISRHHAEIRTSGDHLWIRDLGSTNGTFVNNKRIFRAELLEDGDILHFGKSKFEVKKEAKEPVDAFESTHIILPDELTFADGMEPRLRAMISQRQVVPHFQPIFRFSDMHTIGYEILGRVSDPELPACPSELIDMAEYLGCGTDLSILFREVGVELGRTLPGNPLLFANTSAVELYQTDVLLNSLVKLRDLAPTSDIIIEINEKAVIEPIKNKEFMRLRDALKNLRIGLAFDDFGVGQTRLLELAKAPPDYLKFDMSLIRQIHLAPKRLHQMVSTFVQAAQSLGIDTIAEGIECPEESETCQELGFNLAQGFLYGRPANIDDIRNDRADGVDIHWQ